MKNLVVLKPGHPLTRLSFIKSLKINSANTLARAETNNLSSLKNTAGRKAKPVTEKQSELIGLRFTKSELELIKAKAGLVPVATYIKNELEVNTDLFKA